MARNGPRFTTGKRLLRVGGFRHPLFELLDLLRRQLRTVHLDRQLVELGGQRERRLVVGVVHAGERVGADVEALVPLQDDRQGLLHASWYATTLPSTLSVPVPGRPSPLKLLNASVPTPRPSYLKSNSSVCRPGRRVPPVPSHFRRFEVDQIPQEHGLALEQVEAVAGEAPAGGQHHAFGAAFRHLDVGGDGVGGVQQ